MSTGCVIYRQCQCGSIAASSWSFTTPQKIQSVCRILNDVIPIMNKERLLGPTSDASDASPLSSISLKQLAALFVSDAMTEETFRQLAGKFFPTAARPSTPGKPSNLPPRPSFESSNLPNSSAANGNIYGSASKGHLAAFSVGGASPQLRQLPMNDRDRYLFSMDLQTMFVLLRVPNLRESDAIRALACLEPMPVHRCIEQLRRCRSASEIARQPGIVTPLASRPSDSKDSRYSSPVWRPAARFSGTSKHSDPQLQTVHVVTNKGVEVSAVFPARLGNQTKRGSSSVQQRPLSAPSPRKWSSSADGAPPALLTERSYALTHRDQVARDVVGAISWLGDVAIDTTSPASLAQRKSRKDFRVAHAASPKQTLSGVGTSNGHIEKSAKKNGLLLQQSNTTSVVIKALQHGRANVSQAGRNHPRHDEKIVQPPRSSSACGSRSIASNWVQSDARFNMHQRRRQVLQQLL